MNLSQFRHSRFKETIESLDNHNNLNEASYTASSSSPPQKKIILMHIYLLLDL